MADIDILPPDVVAELKASGVKFDKDGNIIDETFITENDTDETQDDVSDDTEDPEEDDDNPDAEGDDDVDELSTDEDEDGADDEDDDEPKKKAVKPADKKALNLTRKKVSDQSDSVNDQIEELKRQNRELQARIESIGKTSDDDEKPEEAIQKEARRFKHMRLQEFRRSVVKTINDLDMGGTFDDIIGSEEWSQYLGSKVFGVKVGDMLKNAIEETNLDDVVSFYTDFVTRYVPQSSKVKPASKQVKKLLPTNGKERLKDLATPDKTVADKKAATTNSRRQAFLYTESDYETMLSRAEKGTISYDDFIKFETKFDAAKKAGRVKLSV